MIFLSFDFDSVKDDYIEGYASVFINGNFFIIGGFFISGEPSNTIARLDSATWSWSRAGQLNTARGGHGAIWVNSKLVVVGGWNTKQTEFCVWGNEEFTCTSKESTLTLKNYSYYPLLFAVTDDYGNC